MRDISEKFNMMSPKHALNVISFLDMFSEGLLMPLLANHMRLLGGSHIMIGVMRALHSGAQLISGPLLGSLSDLKGRKTTLLLCLSICGVSYFLLGLISSVFIFLVINFVTGLTKQTQLFTKALNSDVQDEGQSLCNRMTSLSNIGIYIGPILGGHLIDAYPDNGFTVITTIVAATVALNLTLIRSLPDIKKKKKSDHELEISSTFLTLFNSSRASLNESTETFCKIDWTVFGDIFILKLFMTLSITMYFGNFGLFLKTQHSISPIYLGYIISFQRVTCSVCIYIVSYICKTDTDLTLRNFHVFLTITFMLISLASAPNVYIFTILLVPLIVANSVGSIISLEMITDKSTLDNIGTVMGASHSIKSLQGVFAPLIVGLINQYLGTVHVFYVAALFTAIGTILSYRLRLQSITSKDK